MGFAVSLGKASAEATILRLSKTAVSDVMIIGGSEDSAARRPKPFLGRAKPFSKPPKPFFGSWSAETVASIITQSIGGEDAAGRRMAAATVDASEVA